MARKTKPIYVSRRVEIEYTKILLSIVRQMYKALNDELLVAIKPQIGDGVQIGDGLFDRVKSALDRISQSIKSTVASVASFIAKRIVGKQKQASDKQLIDILKQQGIDLTGLMRDEELDEAVREAIAANVALINSIPAQYLDRVEQMVMSGLQTGTLNKTFADELKRLTGITESRARLIATDQLAKINTRFSQIRQEALGITHYTWVTSRDERVRPEHQARDGKLYAWASPPSDGHPGQPIRCRCVAKPVLNFDSRQ